MSNSNRTLVSIATYNELENLPDLIAAVVHHVPTADILVVDDNSPDGTGQWCAQRAAEDGRLRCIHRSEKLGLGTAIVAAMKYAIEHGYDLLVTMDADFSHDPKYVPALIAAVAGTQGRHVDVAIGSRYVAGGATEGWDLERRLMSRCVNLYARYLLGLTPKDCSGAFRCFRTRTLTKVNFQSIQSWGYSFQEEILYHLKCVGARFDEVPILFRDRKRGLSKINSAEALAAIRVIFRLGMHARLGI